MTIEAGQQLLHYRLIRKLGQGGMGVVFEATDTRLDRNVALKVLPPELMQDPERSTRFHQEARLAAAFNHPNIATVHDVGEQRGVTFIVMELVRGESLRALVRDAPLRVARALDIAVGIAAGLARAHREGVLHRDLKPDNVMLTDDGVPKILDFGLSKLIDQRGSPEGSSPTEEATVTARNAPSLTRAGQVFGTLAYMSPEQVQGRPVDARTDVFSFGVLLYEMLAGERPFVGKSDLDTATAILRDDPESLDRLRQDIPPELKEIISRSLAKEPAERFASGQELHEALLALKGRLDTPIAGLGVLLRRPGILAVVVVLVALAGGGLAWLTHRNSRVSWARNAALPEIVRLYESGDRDAAMRLLYEVSEIIPDDPQLLQYLASLTIRVTLDSDPSGATVYAKGYNSPDREWIRLGETPIESVPVATPTRFRVEKEGYVTFEGAPFDVRHTFRLFHEDEVPPGMVLVPAGTVEFGASEPVELTDFWIDKYEVTNRSSR